MARVSRAPGMYLPEVSYVALVSYVYGSDAITGGRLLAGFNEWAAKKLSGETSSLAWHGQIREYIDARKNSSERSADADKWDLLLRLLDEFLAEDDRDLR